MNRCYGRTGRAEATDRVALRTPCTAEAVVPPVYGFTMTSNPMNPEGPILQVVAPPDLSVDEIAAWLDEIEPILAVVCEDDRLSAGASRWVIDQMPFAEDVASWMVEIAFEGEASDQDLFDVMWIGNRVQCALARMHSVLLSQLAA